MQYRNVARWLEFPADLLREVHPILMKADLTLCEDGHIESGILNFQHSAAVPHLGFHVCMDMVNLDMMNSLGRVVGFGPCQQMQAAHALSVHLGFHSVALSEAACHAS